MAKPQDDDEALTPEQIAADEALIAEIREALGDDGLG